MNKLFNFIVSVSFAALITAFLGLCIAVPVLLHESNKNTAKIAEEAGRIADEMNELRKQLSR